MAAVGHRESWIADAAANGGSGIRATGRGRDVVRYAELRRAHADEPADENGAVTVADVTLDPSTRSATLGGKPLVLTSTESLGNSPQLLGTRSRGWLSVIFCWPGTAHRFSKWRNALFMTLPRNVPKTQESIDRCCPRPEQAKGHHRRAIYRAHQRPGLDLRYVWGQPLQVAVCCHRVF